MSAHTITTTATMKNIPRACDAFFAVMDAQFLGLSYDDVLLIPRYSDVLPSEIDLRARISRNIMMNIPVVSSPMDNVTEEDMAIVLAEEGGMGIIHKNLSPEAQAKAVRKVKHRIAAFVSSPICVRINQTVAEVMEVAARKKYPFRSYPVKDEDGKVVGILSNREVEYCSDHSRKVSEIMVTNIISAQELDDVQMAYNVMKDKHIGILPKFNNCGDFLGIYTWTDAKRIVEKGSANYNLAPDGTLRVGAAVGVLNKNNDVTQRRVQLLSEAGVDLLVIDTSKGDSANVVAMVKFCKENYPHIDVVAGNIATADASRLLRDAGVSAVRVGVGPGSICTTRVISGVGYPQLSAVYECARALRGSGVAVWADGGIRFSGDITKALGAGADVVMLGSILAATTESPGDVIELPGGKKWKLYRGMGSLGAMKAHQESRDRYKQTGTAGDKLVPEGVEGNVLYKGDAAGVLYQMLGGLRSGMGNCGAGTISELQELAEFVRITPAGKTESHPGSGLVQFDGTTNYQG